MIAYLIMFALSLSLIWIGIKSNNKIIKIILIAAGLLLPCIMAGMRDISIGTDTKGYIHNLYSLSKESKSIFNFYDTAYAWYVERDYAYLTITYFAAKCGLSFGALLFIYECLIIIPLFASFRKIKMSNRATMIGMAIVFLVLYNVTYNMLRQSIAIAFTTLAFTSYLTCKTKGQLIVTVLEIILAIGFHSTAIAIIPIILLHKYYTNNKHLTKQKQLLSILLIISSIAIVIFYSAFLQLLAKTGVYSNATYYLDHYSTKDFSLYQFVINLLMIAIIIGNKKKIIANKMPYRFLVIMALTNMIISSGLGYFIMYSQRIMLYIQYILLLCYTPLIITWNKKITKTTLLFMLALLGTWVMYYGYKNVGETVPYRTQSNTLNYIETYSNQEIV